MRRTLPHKPMRQTKRVAVRHVDSTATEFGLTDLGQHRYGHTEGDKGPRDKADVMPAEMSG